MATKLKQESQGWGRRIHSIDCNIQTKPKELILDPDVAVAFPTTESVNEALGLVMKLSAIPAAKH